MADVQHSFRDPHWSYLGPTCFEETILALIPLEFGSMVTRVEGRRPANHLPARPLLVLQGRVRRRDGHRRDAVHRAARRVDQRRTCAAVLPPLGARRAPQGRRRRHQPDGDHGGRGLRAAHRLVQRVSRVALNLARARNAGGRAHPGRTALGLHSVRRIRIPRPASGEHRRIPGAVLPAGSGAHCGRGQACSACPVVVPREPLAFDERFMQRRAWIDALAAQHPAPGGAKTQPTDFVEVPPEKQNIDITEILPLSDGARTVAYTEDTVVIQLRSDFIQDWDDEFAAGASLRVRPRRSADRRPARQRRRLRFARSTDGALSECDGAGAPEFRVWIPRARDIAGVERAAASLRVAGVARLRILLDGL